MKKLFVLILFVSMFTGCSRDSTDVKSEELNFDISANRLGFGENKEIELITFLRVDSFTSDTFVTLANGEYIEAIIDGTSYQPDMIDSEVHTKFTLNVTDELAKNVELIMHRVNESDISISFTMPPPIEIFEPATANGDFDISLDSLFVSWNNQGFNDVSLSIYDRGPVNCLDVSYSEKFLDNTQQHTIAAGEMELRKDCREGDETEGNQLFGGVSTFNQDLSFATTHDRSRVLLEYSDYSSEFVVGNLITP